MAEEKLIAVGIIVGAHGIRGSLKVKSFCEDPAIFDTPCPLTVSQQNRVSYRVDACRMHGRSLIIDLEGITTRDQAQQLAGAQLLLPISAFPAPEADTYYWFELIGLEVKTLDGKSIGKVYRLISAGPQDILVVRNTESEIMIPMVESFVKTIEIAQQAIWVDLPENMPIEKLENLAHPVTGASCIS
jgi:16S rRNA processing protein RimM